MVGASTTREENKLHNYTGGRLPAQGLAFSNCAASLNNEASSPNLPENITPIGNPSAGQCNGTDIEG